MANFIVRVITWGLIFLSTGTLMEVTFETMGLAAKSSRTGLVNLSKLNQALSGRNK